VLVGHEISFAEYGSANDSLFVRVAVRVEMAASAIHPRSGDRDSSSIDAWLLTIPAKSAWRGLSRSWDTARGRRRPN